MKPFQLTVKAKQDLKDIAVYTQRVWGKEQRNTYIKSFDKTFWILAENPLLGKSANEIRDGYLKFPQGSHIIFYKQTANRHIEIIRILHKSMDVTSILSC